MTTLCLTGWQQRADALANITPEATLFADYSGFNDVASFFATLPQEVELAIGWSLGGQLLVRAIAGGYVKANRLILLGAPFQFMASAAFSEAMPAEAFKGVIEQYRTHPQAMVKQFAGIISTGDSFAPRIARTLGQYTDVWKQGIFWLEELARYSCAELNFSTLPPTLLVHGLKDKVIYPIQAEWFRQHLPHAELHLWPECGHAPHLHDEASLRQLVGRHV